MSGFYDFFVLGFSNIAFLNVFVHILFIIALCGIYTFKHWKLVVSFLLTFVVGYLITFFLSTFNIVVVPEKPLIFLLPLTIFIAAVSNFNLKRNTFVNRTPSQKYRYWLAFIAGNIHGLAFPEILKPLLTADEMFHQVLAFNLGILSALILIVFFLLSTISFLTYFIRVNIREWNLMISGACAGIAVYILANNFLP